MHRAVESYGSEGKGIGPLGDKWEESEAGKEENEVARAGNTSAQPGSAIDL
jgi:hypothetical protein